MHVSLSCHCVELIGVRKSNFNLNNYMVQVVMLLSIVYSHTAWFRIDVPGTKPEEMKYLTSTGGKFLHLETNKSPHVKTLGKPLETITSKDVVYKSTSFYKDGSMINGIYLQIINLQLIQFM